MEVEIEGKSFKLEKLSGYKLIKISEQTKDNADLIRDLILESVKEPELTREDVEKLDASLFMQLGTEIIKLHEGDLKKLQNLAKSNKR